jgi:hypothetical protein
MIHEFTEENIMSIGSVLNCIPKKLGDDVYRLELDGDGDNPKLALEIHLGMEFENKRMNMVSVYSGSTFIQLHNCTAFIASDMLKQVTFFGKQGGYTSGLIVEEAAACNFYANVDDSVLKKNFAALPEDMMMCGVALSLTDTLDSDDFSFDDDKLS